MVTTTMMVTEKEGKGNGYTTIPVMPSTKNRLALSMPKGWDWDQIIVTLTEMWEKQQGKTIKIGKSPQDNQAS